MDEIINNLILELRRGTLMLSVLSQLRERQYGYSLKERLAEQGMDIDQGTLYPLLRRLEKQGLLDSEWDLGETRPRRYYTLSAQGQAVLTAMIAEWRQLVEVMEQVLPADNG